MRDGNEGTLRFIPAKSKRESLDFALVLASQGIEPILVRDDRGWGLEVEVVEHEKAGKALALYQQENPQRRWKYLPPAGTDYIHGAVVIFCGVLIAIHLLKTPQVAEAGMNIAAKLKQGEWWRLITATTLHGDTPHLVSNLTTGLVMVGLAMGRYGVGPGLLGALLAGVAGNLCSFFMYGPEFRGLGASGVVLGALGMLGVQRFLWKSALAKRLLLTGMGAAVMILALFGFAPGTDVIAHVGGFVGGVVIALLLNLIPLKRLQSVGFSMTCLAVALGLVIAAWKLALGKLS